MSTLIENHGGAATNGPAERNGARGPGDKGPSVRIVRYGAMSWVGEFAHKPNVTIPCGARVVIQSDRGIELGETLGPYCAGCEPAGFRPQIQAYVKNSGADFCRPRSGRILRLANDQDLNEQRHLNAHVRQDIDHCAEVAAQLSLDMKVITAEHLLGGERIVFYFQAPTRVDFRQLVKDLAQRYRTRIEMRQVGARDEARLVADFEVCGRECCCRNFLKKLRPVNMKMAKLQKSTLDPSKVSGRCGRLRCCLRYEHLGYEELAERLPRVGSRVEIEVGPGTVLDRQILTQLVAVRTDDDRVFTVTIEQIRAFDLPPAPRKQELDSPVAQLDADRPARGARPPRRRPSGPPPRLPAGPNLEAPVEADEPEEPASPALPPTTRSPAAAPPPPSQTAPATPSKPAAPAAAAPPPGAPAPKSSSSSRRRRRRRQAQDGQTKPPSSEGPAS